MTYFLITLNIVLLVIIGAILVLFNRQGKRLNEEIQHAIDDEDIKSQYLEEVGVTFKDALDKIIHSCEDIESQPCINQHPDVARTIEDIRFSSQQLTQYAQEIRAMSNTQGIIPHSKKLQVNLVELIMSYRREIMYEVNDDVQVNMQTKLSPHTKVWVDTTMFRQLVMHILHCAAKTTALGYINIRYAKEKDGLRFWFENTSDAIPSDVINTIFTSEKDSASQVNGTCDKDTIMSLSLCKSIISSLKGKIEATSEQKDSEYLNVITFWFPCVLTTD
ncbi:MAG: HAMP domain-containing histidine kinase [Bacteroidaceae bacterium]|nr:HAMP domain-containing histidine kinase [Bacteroidaceae bacterium]